jgi:hypothetical protein
LEVQGGGKPLHAESLRRRLAAGYSVANYFWGMNMNERVFEIPRRLVAALKTIGPVHTEVRGGYWFELQLVVAGDDEPAGVLIEQRLAERGEEPVAAGQGISFRAPAQAERGGEATYVYAETLAEALGFIAGR